MFKNYIQKRLEKFVQAYFVAHPEIKLIVVTGSVGKTSTKSAVATLLSTRYRVRMEDNNHNTHMSAPLGILGIEYPEKVHSVFAWLQVFRAAKRRIKQPSDVDVIVQELGTDHPGDIPHFGSYLRPAVAVITAITPEHMEFFGSIEAVAQEELSVANFSGLALINRDDIDGRFAGLITNPAIDTYGTTSAAEYRFETDDTTILNGYSGQIYAPELQAPLQATIGVIGEHSLRPIMAAVAVALKMGITVENIIKGISMCRPVAGRMNMLRGVNQSILIDDTYNSSPAAAAAALQTLYLVNAPQRIAILGSMNELGTSSQAEHEQIGMLCDPNLLAWVVTIGSDAEQFLAPKARARGCQVKSFRSAIDAGAFVHQVIEQNAVVLAKGSQGNVYAEEALKILLHETEEDRQLVRQLPQWLKIKNDFFATFSK